MPRAMLELRAAMPGVRTDPLSGQERGAGRGPLVAHQRGARRMVVEYCKYLAILAREAVLSLGPKDHHTSAAPAGPAPAGGQG